MEPQSNSNSFTHRVIAYIRQVPRGRVATYGQIAGLAGSPRSAIAVGQILHRQTEKYNLPWQRVINSKGQISTTCLEHPAGLQASLLVNDGVEVLEKDQQFFVNLHTYLWRVKADETDTDMG